MTNTAGNLLDSVIGEDSHLADADLQTLLQLASLDAIRRAVALGLGVEGAQVLQVFDTWGGVRSADGLRRPTSSRPWMLTSKT